MVELIQQFKEPVDLDKTAYLVRVYGEQRRDGTWTAWLEFHPVLDTAPILRTERETTQPDRTSLAHWASGLGSHYFGNALTRAQINRTS
jgi:hypothetical protein